MDPETSVQPPDMKPTEMPQELWLGDSGVIARAAPPVLVFNQDGSLRLFSLSAGETFGLTVVDIGRPADELSAALGIPGFAHIIADSMEGTEAIEGEVQDTRGRWYSLRRQANRTLGDDLPSVIVSLTDITKLKVEAIQTHAYAEALGEAVRESVLVLDSDLRVKAANRTFFKSFHTTAANTLGRHLQDLGSGEWKIPRLFGLLREILSRQPGSKEFELEHEFPTAGRRRMQISFTPVRVDRGTSPLILLLIEDVTDRTRTEESLESSEARLRALVRSIDDVVFEIDQDGSCLSAWTGNSRLLGRSAAGIPSHSIEDFLPTRSYPPLREGLDRVIKNDKPENVEYSLDLGESKRWFQARINRISSAPSARQTFSVLVRDITARKEAEFALLQSEERFRLLVEGVKDYAIYALDTEGRVVSWNRGAERIKGYRREEILGKHFSIFYVPEDIAAGKPDKDLQIAAAEGRFEDVSGWRVRKDGSRFFASLLVAAIRDKDGTLLGYTKITRDITDQKRAEQAVRQLSGHILRVQDEERRRIARELHDSTAQLLTALSMNLSLAAKCPSVTRDVQASKLLGESEVLARQAGDEIRNVSHLLHPPDLDAVGLVAAIRWYATRFQDRTSIAVKLNLPVSMRRLPQDIEIALFRVVQESLTNVQRHSGSDSARIKIVQRGADVELEIDDKGHGIPAEILGKQQPSAERLGIGIAGMRERLKQLGGSLEIISTSQGTKVKATVPCAG